MTKVFYDKSSEGSVGFPIKSILGIQPKSGDVGIEIEVESSNSLLKSNSDLAPWWSYHPDGSLRGYDSAEYVLTKPIKFDEVNTALTFLWDKFSHYKSKLNDSNRTSVHVHLNCQDFHLNRLTSFCALYFCFEEVLTEWCGEHRVGNLFCLRAKDAPAIIGQVRRFVRSDGQRELRDGLHYSGLNVSALSKFGSLEVRTLRGVTDPVVIENWVKILRRIYDLSAEYTDPRDVCGAFSAQGPLAFFDTVLGEVGPVVRDGIPFNDDQIRNSMYEGIRMAQDLCYCRDWDRFKPTSVKDDPFGRDPRKVAKKLINLGSHGIAAAQEDYPEYEASVPTQVTYAYAPPPSQPGPPPPITFQQAVAQAQAAQAALQQSDNEFWAQYQMPAHTIPEAPE